MIHSTCNDLKGQTIKKRLTFGQHFKNYKKKSKIEIETPFVSSNGTFFLSKKNLDGVALYRAFFLNWWVSINCYHLLLYCAQYETTWNFLFTFQSVHHTKKGNNRKCVCVWACGCVFVCVCELRLRITNFTRFVTLKMLL